MATPDIVGAAEAADILSIGNTNFSHLRKQREGRDDAFPDPLVTLKCGPIWLRKDVEKFAKTFTPGKRGARPGTPTKKVAPAKKAVAKAPVKKKLALVR